ncbi:MAG: hypothetical protein RB191_18630 [Terriglobia bacterium]|nr:hypothetical protein [Terriglobia bacterium]
MYGTKKKRVDLGSKGSFTEHPGGLHEALHIPMGSKIPASDLSPKPGDSEHVRRMKASARGFKAMQH